MCNSVRFSPWFYALYSPLPLSIFQIHALSITFSSVNFPSIATITFPWRKSSVISWHICALPKVLSSLELDLFAEICLYACKFLLFSPRGRPRSFPSYSSSSPLSGLTAIDPRKVLLDLLGGGWEMRLWKSELIFIIGEFGALDLGKGRAGLGCGAAGGNCLLWNFGFVFCTKCAIFGHFLTIYQ